jgi:HAD superfamily hydrolase (TIGR01490 family)
VVTSAGTPDGEPAGQAAAFFDLDKTIIARSSTLAFSRAFFEGGLLSRRSALRSAYAQFMFGRSGADHDQMERMRAYLSQLSAGWQVQTVRDIVAETLHTIVDPLVYDEAVGLIEEHRAAGRDVVIVSTSGAEVVEPIGQMLGVDHVIATQMVVEDGRYTGEIAFYAFGPNKASAIRELAVERGYDLDSSYGYSDSETDLPLLEAVGRPHAVNPDRTLRRAAEERGWPVLFFTRPVTLRRRMGLRPRPRQLVVLLGIAAAVGATVAWQLQRHGPPGLARWRRAQSEAPTTRRRGLPRQRGQA